MAYRNGVYIAFAADGQTDPTKSDIKYYNLLKAWDALKTIDFQFVNSHDKASACRDTSQAATIKASLRERLKNSKVMLLFVGNTTRFDTDFVPYEIEFGVDTCKLPIIVCYVDSRARITGNIPDTLKSLWPKALANRINANSVKTIHIPLARKIVEQAISEIDINNPPQYTVALYKASIYEKFGL